MLSLALPGSVFSSSSSVVGSVFSISSSAVDSTFSHFANTSMVLLSSKLTFWSKENSSSVVPSTVYQPANS